MPTSTDDNARVIALRGTPGRMLLHSELPEDLGDDFQVTYEGPLGELVYGKPRYRIRASRDSAGKLRRLSARLPESTPPGTYRATMKSAGADYEVMLEVQEKPRLHVNPLSIHLRGSPREKQTVTLLFHNRGNVDIDIPERDAVGVYDDDGVENAFASSYNMDSNDPMELLRNFIEKLRGGHGGLLKIRVKEGAGNLPAGTQRPVTLEFQIPEPARGGHQYHGVWSIGPSEYPITLAVSK